MPFYASFSSFMPLYMPLGLLTLIASLSPSLSSRSLKPKSPLLTPLAATPYRYYPLLATALINIAL